MKVKYIAANTLEFLDKVWSYFMRPAVRMSNSRLNMYETCPLKYRFYYEEHMKGFPSAPLHFGSVVHQALKEFHSKFDLQGEQGTLDELIREYDRAWDMVKEDMLESTGGPPTNKWKVALAESGASKEDTAFALSRLNTIYISPEEEEKFRERGLRMLEEYFKDNQTNPNRIIQLEKQLNLTIKGIDIVAYLDRLEKTPGGDLEIVDYKTGKRVKDMETINLLGGDTQAIIYSMIIEKKWGRRPKNFYYYYLDKRLKVPCKPEPRHIKNVFQKIEMTVSNIKYRNFEPHQGPLCGWCDYEVICPAWKGRLEPFRGIFRQAREEGRMTFSYSKMSSYKNCPYNYMKIDIEKIAPKPRHFFSIGHSCHETFEEFYSKPYQSSLRKLRKMFERNWHSEGYRDEAEEMKYKRDGWQWCKNYYLKYIDGKFKPAYAVELYFQLPIGDDYVVIGYIDRIEKNDDGTFTIVDYKTDPKMRTQEEVDNDVQLTFYYWAMRELGMEVRELSLEFLKFNQRVITRRTPEDIPPFIEDVNRTVGEMALKEKLYEEDPERAAELFPPKINKYCGGCDHLVGCPKEEEIRTKHKDYVMNLDPPPEPDPEENPDPDKIEETKEDK